MSRSASGQPSAVETPLDGSAPTSAAAAVTLRLPDDQLAELARLVADELRAPPAAAGVPAAAAWATAEEHKRVPEIDRELVTADALARRLGVSRSHVYEHADALGAVRLGDGPRARLRFDLETARAALARYSSERSVAPNASAGAESVPPARPRRRSLATRRPQPGSILPSRPREAGRAAGPRGEP